MFQYCLNWTKWGANWQGALWVDATIASKELPSAEADGSRYSFSSRTLATGSFATEEQ
jgi:hypothetical protein